MKKRFYQLAGVGASILLAYQPLNAFAETNTYQVQKGDTLSKIAIQHNIPLDKLIQQNNITNKDVIYPGQILHTKTTSSATTNNDVENQFRNRGIFPIDQQYYNITSNYGQRVHPITGNPTSFHYGIDLAKQGINRSPIYSVLPGSVLHAGNTYNGYGNYVIIQHDGFQTLYAHMAETPTVRKGQTVQAGDQIGLVGSTGNSTGPHLHFELSIQGKQVDPKPYLDLIVKRVTPNNSTQTPNPTGGKNTLTYTVKRGDTVNKIAAQHQTTREEIVRINQLKSANFIVVGQKLLIKQQSQAQTPPVNNKPTTYTVRSGDSLWTISRKTAVSVQQLKQQNNLTSDIIYVGQTLTLNNTQPTSKPTPKPTTTKSYTVQRGDNLWKIANQHGQTVKQLKDTNNLTSDLIFVGQTLTI